MILRLSILCSFLFLLTSQTACNMVPGRALRASQYQSRQLYAQMNQYKQMAEGSGSNLQQLEQANADLQNRLSVSDQRLANLQSEREQVHSKYKNLLASVRSKKSPLSESATGKFKALADKYPEFDFDPETGVSKFHSDILFASGSDKVRTTGTPLLREFASIMNEGNARRLNILVVGHTDDKLIRKTSTRRRHESNWHLSTDRANEVVMNLSKLGINETRMGAAGYSKYQPVVPNSGSESRQRNRRVEIFVLAPDAAIAGWDPATSHR